MTPVMFAAAVLPSLNARYGNPGGLGETPASKATPILRAAPQAVTSTPPIRPTSRGLVSRLVTSTIFFTAAFLLPS
jgi:hypothetical protein